MRTRDANAATRLCCLTEVDCGHGASSLEVPVLASQTLAISYHRRAAVDRVTLAFPRHRVTAIVGPSGSGKSSYLQCLNRLHETVPGCRRSGDICFEGKSIFAPDVDPAMLRLRIGMIFQRPTPFPLSIRSNVTIGLKEHFRIGRSERDDRAEQALRRVGLWREVSDRLDAPASSLSGGQQQRLCLARALALEPSVLLLDEPCSALDPISTGVIEDLIVELKTSTTIVIVTHNLAQARRVADKLAVFWLRDGVGYLAETGSAVTTFDAATTVEAQRYLAGLAG